MKNNNYQNINIEDKNVKTKNNTGSNVKIFFGIIFALLALYTFIMFFIYAFGFINSVKTAKEYLFNKSKLPYEDGWNFSNYLTAFSAIYVKVRTSTGFAYQGVVDMYINTILYAVGCGFLSTLVPCITAYLTARFNYKFSDIIVGIVIVTMSLPIVGSTPSSLQLARTFHFYDNIWGLWIMSANFQMGIHFLVFHDAFRGFPAAYKEAAEIDGASHMQIMIRIMMPLVKNLFATVFLLRVIGYWNEYQTPLLYMPNHPTIAYGLYYFTYLNFDNNTFSVPMQLTGAFIVSIPIFVVFCLFQNRIMSNLSIGGIKG